VPSREPSFDPNFAGDEGGVPSREVNP
jgi:hypothetical protein